ncbi:MAG: transposase [Nitrosopumilaceae archaeon]|nr:transposase [Nitrosopumilaceae archaeon]
MEGFMEDAILGLLHDHPRPARRTSGPGARPAHSETKLDFACLGMTSENDPYRSACRRLWRMRHVWDEPILSHKELVEHMQTIDAGWLDCILAKTAFLCLEELAISGAAAPLGADSSGAEAARYEYTEAPGVTLHDFMPPDAERPRFKTYLKYHVTAVLGHQVILTAITTPGSVHDSRMLPAMLEKIRKFGFDFSGRYFNADRGYDSDDNFEKVFESGMIPNIRQRQYRGQRGAPPNPAKTCRALAGGDVQPLRIRAEIIH